MGANRSNDVSLFYPSKINIYRYRFEEDLLNF